ncbi:hypothetical protein B0H14DRAFT_2635754 [Mycena olivaceomarginata]|nr:hypothetical protein B0H14DRAFT_2635754 [Mycena olivaceomarginata]
MAAAMRLASISQLCSAIHRPFWDVAWGAAINILMADCCDGMGLPARVGGHPAAVHQSRQLWSPRLHAAQHRFPRPRACVPPAAAAARPPAQCVVWDYSCWLHFKNQCRRSPPTDLKEHRLSVSKLLPIATQRTVGCNNAFSDRHAASDFR